MKRTILAVLSSLVIPAVAMASPFLVSDPNPSAVGGYSDITGAAWIPNPVPLQADGAVKVDVAGAPIGPSNVQVRVCKDDPVWGLQCSPFVPFTWTRPGGPSAPGNMGLIK